MKKYELVGEYKFNGVVLKRIRALMDFSDVKEGDIGGYVESEDNLSQDGTCWVYDQAKVYDDAYVYDDAIVCGGAVVYGDARIFCNAFISDSAIVWEYACIYGNAIINGNSRIYGTSLVYGNAWINDNAIIRGSAKVYGNAQVIMDGIICMGSINSGVIASAYNNDLYDLNIVNYKPDIKISNTTPWELVCMAFDARNAAERTMALMHYGATPSKLKEYSNDIYLSMCMVLAKTDNEINMMLEQYRSICKAEGGDLKRKAEYAIKNRYDNILKKIAMAVSEWAVVMDRNNNLGGFKNEKI